MKTPDLKHNILEFIKCNGDTLYNELSMLVPGVEGEYMDCVDSEYGPIVFWPWLTRDAITAIHELTREGSIKLQPSSFMVYAHSGGRIPNFPVAGAMRKSDKLRWVVCSLQPPCRT